MKPTQMRTAASNSVRYAHPTAVAKAAGYKLFEKHLKKYEPVDALYETYTDENGRQQLRKREIPPGLSKRDARVLKSVKKHSHRLDAGLSLCGFRVGWTFVVGLIPGVGDALNGFLGYYLIVRKAKQADIPPWLYNKMVGNQVISTVVGFVPLAGDIVVAVLKANSRNAALLEEFLRVRGEEFLKDQADRVGDPEVVRPGAGLEVNEKIPEKAPSQSRLGFFRRSSKKVPTTQDAPAEGKDVPKEKSETKSKDEGGAKGKGKGNSQ